MGSTTRDIINEKDVSQNYEQYLVDLQKELWSNSRENKGVFL